MFTKSLWNAYSGDTSFPQLRGNIEVDVAVIGGGITGITTAQLLKEQGLQVAVLEARKVGRGTTAHSTGNLYEITDQLLSPLYSKYDIGIIKKVLQARRESVNFIAENIKHYNIDCDFTRQPMFIFEDEGGDHIDKERKIAEEGGLMFSEIRQENFPFELGRGIKLNDQAYFNPLLYIQALAREINGGNCQIYENTDITEIDEEEERVVLSSGTAEITAKNVIHATHTPKGVRIQYHTVLGPYREYGIAAKLASGSYPEGIFWGYFNKEKYSLRSYSRGGEKYLLCVGRPHKVGQAEDNQRHIQNLEAFLRKRFSISEISYRWGGQHYKPGDLLPYIGRKDSGSRQFVATGFSTDGLTYGTLSARILSDLLTNRDNPYSELFKASRHNPGKAAQKFIKENVNVAGQMLKDYLSKPDEPELREIQPGEAKIISKNDERAAVYRTPEGELQAYSAVCTHMGCIVDWNNAEKTWDCPCHGSRFSTNGEVLEGPALKALGAVGEKIIDKSLNEKDDERE